MEKMIHVSGRPMLELVNPKRTDTSDRITKKWQDLELAVYVLIEDGTEYKKIDSKDALGAVDQDLLWATAEHNMAKRAKISTLADVANEYLEDSDTLKVELDEDTADELRAILDETSEEKDEEPMWIITTKDGYLGAAAVTLPEVQKDLEKKNGQ